MGMSSIFSETQGGTEKIQVPPSSISASTSDTQSQPKPPPQALEFESLQAIQPEGKRWAIAAARIADNKLGRGTVMIDVGQVLGITDYFVITNGGNHRQVEAIVEEIEAQIASLGGPRPYRIEGRQNLAWVLLDYVDFVVHVFDPKARDYYDLERLWKDQPYVKWS